MSFLTNTDLLIKLNIIQTLLDKIKTLKINFQIFSHKVFNSRLLITSIQKTPKPAPIARFRNN